MLQTMKNRLKSKKGFTLMEMLIVVAIIAILVAIAFPVFNSQLEKSRTATDEANVRAAKSVANTMYLSDAADDTTTAPVVDDYFDVGTGKFVTGSKPAGYGKSAANKGKVIQVATVASSGTDYTFKWS